LISCSFLLIPHSSTWNLSLFLYLSLTHSFNSRKEMKNMAGAPIEQYCLILQRLPTIIMPRCSGMH
jgi:hypothetical protein